MDEEDFDKSYKIPDEDKLNSAKQFKQEGNDAYKEKEYKKAIGKYHRALLHLKGIGQMHVGSLFNASISNGDASNGMCESNRQNALDPQLVSDVTDVKTDCYNNLAACLLQEEEPKYKRIIHYCDLVLETAPNNKKAIFRKGKSQFFLKEYDNAIESFNKIPNEPESQKFVDSSKKELDKQNKSMQKNLSRMFDSKQTKNDAGDS